MFRETSPLTESRYLAWWNVECQDVVGGEEPFLTIENSKIIEITGWPERFVRWYGDKFGIAPIADERSEP